MEVIVPLDCLVQKRVVLKEDIVRDGVEGM